MTKNEKILINGIKAHIETLKGYIAYYKRSLNSCYTTEERWACELGVEHNEETEKLFTDLLEKIK